MEINKELREKLLRAPNPLKSQKKTQPEDLRNRFLAILEYNKNLQIEKSTVNTSKFGIDKIIEDASIGNTIPDQNSFSFKFHLGEDLQEGVEYEVEKNIDLSQII